MEAGIESLPVSTNATDGVLAGEEDDDVEDVDGDDGDDGDDVGDVGLCMGFPSTPS